MLKAVQGRLPTEIEVVLGTKERARFRVEDFFYYYLQLKNAFLALNAEFDSSDKPMPSGFEDCGKWSEHAEALLEQADHLSRVANITSLQVRRLEAAGVKTMAQLASNRTQKVKKMQPAILDRLRKQARLQIESKDLKRPKYELVQQDPEDPKRGLALLPPASKLDVYFDMEGYPFAVGGLEYLFGAAYRDGKNEEFTDWWGLDSAQEKIAFEGFVKWAHGRWRKDPSMHIYHYANYEVAAVRKLMGRHGVCEDEVDDLLRHGVFVDLYTVVRQGFLIGEPGYSIKNIEHIYQESRGGDVATAGDSMVFFQRWLATKDGADWKTSPTLKAIRDYNKEDCVSTLRLADWLWEEQRKAKIEWIGDAHEDDEEEAETPEPHPARELAERLTKKFADGLAKGDDDARVGQLLAWLLEFHRRESKPVFWAMFDRHEKTEEELVDDPDCLGEIERTNKAPVQVKRSFLYEYRFDPDQDTKMDTGSRCFFAHDLAQKVEIEEFDGEKGLVCIKMAAKRGSPPDRLSLIPDEHVDPGCISKSIMETVEKWADGGKLPPAIEDFLFRRRPRIKGNQSGPIVPPTGDLLEGTVAAVANLDKSTLCIQGPPGSGKTWTAAHAIQKLVFSGKRVGITSNSHKAIMNLLDCLAKLFKKTGKPFRASKIGGDAEDVKQEGIVHSQSVANTDLDGPDARVVGGTAWAFSHETARGKFDYLFVDEAGQVSLANLVGMAPCAKNIVLMGDQMQLSQPIKGSHPGESGLSILDYLLQDRPTIPDDLGIFLGRTWRMHPSVCKFISDSVYESRLLPDANTANRVVRLPKNGGALIKKEAGVVFVPVEHEDNTQCSDEEVVAIKNIVKELTGRELTDIKSKVARKLGIEDILFVAPYNMQVRRLKNALGEKGSAQLTNSRGRRLPS
jgi:uncharacterized protein